MAFGFFRRHQKAVIVIMVLLMVAFLLTATSFQSILDFFSPHKNPARGTAYGENVTARDVQEAAIQLDLLKRIPFDRLIETRDDQPGQKMARMLVPGQKVSDLDMLRLLQTNGRNAELAFALLKAEAKHAGVAVSEQEIRDALGAMSPMAVQGEHVGDEVYSQFTTGLKATKDDLRNTMAAWLMVSKNFAVNMPTAPPSVPELRHLYSELSDRINLRMVQLPAVNPLMVSQNPNEAQFLEQFKKHRDVEAGNYTKENPFGFGYRKPDRAAIEWLEIRDDMIRRAAQPTEKQIEEYFSANLNKFKDKYLDEVRPQIIAALSESSIASKLDAVTAAVTAEVKKVSAQKDLKNIYPVVVASMKADATGALGRKVKVNLQAVELGKAMEKLATVSGVKIVYPMGEMGLTTISDKVKVTLNTDGMTLGQALQQITDQVFNVTPMATSAPASAPAPSSGVKIAWCGLKGLNDVIFADNNDLNTYPLRAQSTHGPRSLIELSHDRTLGSATLTDNFQAYVRERMARYQGQRGQVRMLLDDVAYAKAFTPEGSEAAAGALEVGQTGPIAYVFQGYNPYPVARMIWHISEALPSHAPTDKEFENDLTLRMDVQNDWKVLQGWQQSLDQGKLILDQAKTAGIDAAAKAHGLTASDTGFFQRLAPGQQAWIPGVPRPEGAMDQALVDQILDQAFALAPTQIDPPYTDKAVGIIQVQPVHMVIIAQRQGFERATQTQFERDRNELTQAIRSQYQMIGIKTWFVLPNIEKRTDWKPAQAEKKVVGEDQ